MPSHRRHSTGAPTGLKLLKPYLKIAIKTIDAGLNGLGSFLKLFFYPFLLFVVLTIFFHYQYTVVSTYQSIQHHFTHCKRHPRNCTWVLAEKGVFWVLGEGKGEETGEEKGWGLDWRDEQRWKHQHDYTLYNHTQQYPYVYSGNLQSCLAYNAQLHNQRPDADNYNPEAQIFTLSLTPSTSTLIKVPELFIVMKRKFVDILDENTLKQIPLSNRIDLNPIMQHLQTLHNDFINLQGAYATYLERWLENTELLSRSWSSTTIRIRALVDDFEKVAKERKERRWWGGTKGGLSELKKGYRNGKRGRRMMQEVRVRHWLQIRFMRQVIQEIVKEGVVLRKALIDIERKVRGFGVLGSVLLDGISKIEEDGVWKKENKAKGLWGLVGLRRLFGGNDGMGKGVSKGDGKYRQEESLVERLVEELKRLEQEIEGKVGELDGMVGVWRKFEKRESIGVGCWFPGVLREYDLGDEEGREEKWQRQWPFEYDSESKDWILQMRRWGRVREGEALVSGMEKALKVVKGLLIEEKGEKGESQ